VYAVKKKKTDRPAPHWNKKWSQETHFRHINTRCKW